MKAQKVFYICVSLLLVLPAAGYQDRTPPTTPSSLTPNSTQIAVPVSNDTVIQTDTFQGLAVGRTAGSGSVTSDGAAEYTLPLWVPPGRAGIRPELSLDYNSRIGNGIVGVGWTLNGLSRITRCRRTFVQDGEPREIRFEDGDDGDRFCLNGQRLVAVGSPDGSQGAYGAHGTEYRTENDIHAKIVSYEPDLFGPTYFKVYLKDGRILTLGGSGNSTLEGQRVNVTATVGSMGGAPSEPPVEWIHDYSQHVRYAWDLSRLEDRSGNYLTVRYSLDIDTLKPDLLVTGLDVLSYTATSIKVQYTIMNVGQSPANLDGPTSSDRDNVRVQAALSTNDAFGTPGDQPLGASVIEPSPLGLLNPGESFTATMETNAPIDPSSQPYLVLKVDSHNAVNESDERNNSKSIQLGSTAGFNEEYLADLIVSDLEILSYTETSIKFQYTVMNIGRASAYLDGPREGNVDYARLQVGLSQDDAFDGPGDRWLADPMLGQLPLGLLNAGESLTGTIETGAPIGDGRWPYLTLKVDNRDVVDEEDEQNNTKAVLIDRPDNAYEHLPAAIEYTAFTDDPTLNATRSVQFFYEGRPDTADYFVSGFKMMRTKRLKRVEMWWDSSPQTATLLHSYQLEYRNDSSSRRSLLSKIQECDNLGICKPPTQFEWTLGPGEFTDTETQINYGPPVQWDQISEDISPADFDGDGRDDIDIDIGDNLPIDLGGYEFSKDSDLCDTLPPISPLDLGGLIPTQNPNQFIKLQPRYVDINGDGREDELTYVGPPPPSGGPQFSYPPFFRNRIQLSTLCGFQLMKDDVEQFGKDTKLAYALDMNGDGLPELVKPLEGTDNWAYRLNSNGSLGDYILTPYIRLFPSGFAPDLYKGLALDINGSGKNSLLIQGGLALSLESGVARATPISSLYRHSPTFQEEFRYIFLDVNGDGLVDALYVGEAPEELDVSINTGNGFTEPEPWNVDAKYDFSRVHLNLDNYKQFIDSGARVVDYNDDGRQDLMLMAGYHPTPQGPRMLVVLESTGSGFVPRPLPIQAGQSSTYKDGLWDPLDWQLSQTLDVNGDGLFDFVQVVDRTLHVYIRQGEKADLLTSIVDGLGAFERFDYSPTSDGGVYAQGDGCEYPQVCLTGAMWVVWRHRVDYGDTGPRDVTFFYQDGRSDISGRGWLGFAKRIAKDRLTRATTTTYYDNQTRVGTLYPCTGFPAKETTDVPLAEGVVRRYTVTTDCEVIIQANDRIYFAYPGRTVTTEWEGEQSQETHLTLLRQSSGSQTLDLYGNVISVEAITYAVNEGRPIGRAHKLNVTATYDNFDASWIIGQLMRAEQTSAVRPGRSTTREITFQHYPNTGLLAKTMAEPEDRYVTEVNGFEYYLETSYERDEFGMVTAIRRDGSGQTRTETLTYDDTDHTFLESITNAAGHVSYFTFHPGFGVLAATTDANDLVTTFQYDGFGRLRQVDAPDDTEVTYHYYADEDGHPVINIRSNAGPPVDLYFDRLGREVARQWQAFDESWVGTERTYDALGRVESVSYPHSLSEPADLREFEYDNLDRLLYLHYPDDAFKRRVYQGLTTHFYDEEGNHSYLVEDELGRVAASVNVDDSGREIRTSYDYGPFSLLEGVTDAYGRRTSMEYDRLGRRIRLEDPNTGITAKRFNAYGEVKDETDGNGHTSTYTFDPLGRVQTITNQDGVTYFTWDTAANGLGMLAASTSPDGVLTEYAYDSLSRPEQISWTIENNVYDVEYTYDRFSRLKTLTYPAIAGRSRLAVMQTYTNLGYLESVRNESDQFIYWSVGSRNARGQLTLERFGNNLTTERGYFDREWLRFIETVKVPTNTTLQSLEYAYESNGNLRRRNDHIFDSVEEFSYDFLNRVRSWEVTQPDNSFVTTYDYDDVGNILNRSVAVSASPLELTTSVDYSYGEGGGGPNAVSQITSDTATWNYTYDDAGNQLTGPGRTIAYTAFNLPSRITGDEEYDIAFQYDALQRRVLKREAHGYSIVYVGDLYEKRITGSTTTHIFHIQGAGRTVAQILWRETDGGDGTDEVLYLHDDHLGSIDTVSDMSGNVVEQLKYSPFGRRRDPKDLGLPIYRSFFGVNLGFTEHEHDDEFGLINMKGRIYDPQIGRFLSADPLVNRPFFGQSYNRYSYVLNNPLTFTDPEGFQDGGDDGTGTATVTTGGYKGSWSVGSITGSSDGSGSQTTGGGPNNNIPSNTGPRVADDNGEHSPPPQENQQGGYEGNRGTTSPERADRRSVQVVQNDPDLARVRAWLNESSPGTGMVTNKESFSPPHLTKAGFVKEYEVGTVSMWVHPSGNWVSYVETQYDPSETEPEKELTESEKKYGWVVHEEEGEFSGPVRYYEDGTIEEEDNTGIVLTYRPNPDGSWSLYSNKPNPDTYLGRIPEEDLP